MPPFTSRLATPLAREVASKLSETGGAICSHLDWQHYWPDKLHQNYLRQGAICSLCMYLLDFFEKNETTKNTILYDF